MAKVPSLKREQREQISQFATRIVKLYNTLQRLHPSGNYHDKVKQSDSIRKLLEVLPLQDRKWITISDPGVNTFPEVLKQILIYVESELALKLTQDDINKEQKVKAGTCEVDSTVVLGSSKKSKNQQQVASNEQSSDKVNNQGAKNKSNPNIGKTCNYCHNLNHIESECKKKKRKQQSGYENLTEYNKDNNFLYKPNQNNPNSESRSSTRCNYCNYMGHTIANCRFRQKNEYQNNSANNNYSSFFCRYCKHAGHLIQDCRKRMWNEEKFKNGIATNGGNASAASSNNSNGSNYNNNPDPRKCYRCNESTHIAKFCPTNAQQNFQ